jgi:hypothetical protein
MLWGLHNVPRRVFRGTSAVLSCPAPAPTPALIHEVIDIDLLSTSASFSLNAMHRSLRRTLPRLRNFGIPELGNLGISGLLNFRDFGNSGDAKQPS